jgi:hypothetical protein
MHAHLLYRHMEFSDLRTFVTPAHGLALGIPGE